MNWNLILGSLAFFGGFLILFLTLCVWAYGWGYKSGHREGRRESNQWWLNMEKEVGEERVKIWREE